MSDIDGSSGETPAICDYEGSTYRTDFWEGQGRDYEHLAERIALRRLLPTRGQRLLDIGAGFGRLADLYAGFEQVILLDYSRSQLEYARSRLGDGRFLYVAGDIYRLPIASNAVDATVMVRVLHHMADVPLAMQQIARAIRPQGHFILEFANKRHLKNLLRHMLGRGPDPYDLQPYQFASLHYDFHPAWVMKMLEQAGFRPQETLSVSLFRSPTLKRLFPPRLLSALDGALQGITAPAMLGPSIFCRSALPKPGQPVIAPALFRCPTCGGHLVPSDDAGLCCDNCRALWPIVNGIYVFR